MQVERQGAAVYCVVPRELWSAIGADLREAFEHDPRLWVIAERRSEERREGDRRAAGTAQSEQVTEDQRRIRAREGRRVADRRATVVPLEPPPLPSALQHFADHLNFVERIEPSSQQLEDVQAARLVNRAQAGDSTAVGELYSMYCDRVFAYVQLTLRDSHESEDVAQESFMRMIQSLSRYERQETPFRGWLFRIVRNLAIDRSRQRARLRIEEPTVLTSRREAVVAEPSTGVWLADDRLMTAVGSLPLAQRQAVTLRYLLDFSTNEIAELMGRSAEATRQLQQRAMSNLRDRLETTSDSDADADADDLGPGIRKTRRDPFRGVVRQRPTESLRFTLVHSLR